MQYSRFVRRKLKDAHTLLKSRRGNKRPRIAMRGLSALQELSIVLVNDRRMRELHQRYMNDRSVTDVLTFPIDTDDAGRVTSGEVYVCVPYARREAKARGVDPTFEVLLYALHGMLHLLGYDDRTAADFRIMHRTEDELLTELGVGPVFAHATHGGRR
jgi:probable rRNA maturation factor